jgi:hypothetical protein
MKEILNSDLKYILQALAIVSLLIGLFFSIHLYLQSALGLLPIFIASSLALLWTTFSLFRNAKRIQV